MCTGYMTRFKGPFRNPDPKDTTLTHRVLILWFAVTLPLFQNAPPWAESLCPSSWVIFGGAKWPKSHGNDRPLYWLSHFFRRPPYWSQKVFIDSPWTSSIFTHFGPIPPLIINEHSPKDSVQCSASLEKEVITGYTLKIRLWKLNVQTWNIWTISLGNDLNLKNHDLWPWPLTLMCAFMTYVTVKLLKHFSYLQNIFTFLKYTTCTSLYIVPPFLKQQSLHEDPAINL